MHNEPICPQCGSTMPSDSRHGVCPTCFLGLGFAVHGETAATEAAARTGTFTAPKPAEIAQHFPRLEILDLIGQGGMGAIYKARQRDLDRIVALKILPPASAEDPAFAERFARESRALASLNHPNIVSVFDSGQSGGLYYFVMEYVDGVNLHQAKQGGKLTAEEALAVIPQICEALQYAHDEGIVHRDIKPENVLLDRKGRVKIADFGLARLLRKTAGDVTLTGTHQVMGTPKYMSPEQMEGVRDVDHRADIYSLGVVFYEMLTGELPLGRFEAPSRRVQVDVRLDEVVLRTLEKEPGRRYQQASEIKSDVDAIVGSTNLHPALQQMLGYEYRSKATLFGWPLLHVANGIDPATQRRRVAKGIIAVGDIAIGVVALGGLSVGGLAFGGCALGLLTLGGFSLGLLAAFGGAAIGLGLSIGGLAVGSVAFGGCAVGIVAVGGGAYGIAALGGNTPSADAPDWLVEFARWINVHRLLVVGIINAAIFFLITAGIATTALCQKFARAHGKPTPGQRRAIW